MCRYSLCLAIRYPYDFVYVILKEIMFHRNLTLAILGLDNAGKTVTTKGLQGGNCCSNILLLTLISRAI